MTDSDSDEDYDIIGIRRSRCRTTMRRQYTCHDVHDELDLRELIEGGEEIISLLHTSRLLLILVSTTLALAKRLKKDGILNALVRVYRTIVSIIALCESELDILSQIEIDLRAIRPEDLPGLHLLPK